MSQEQFSQNELPPQQKRIKDAERAFRIARTNGFPDQLATQYSAHWSSLGVERDSIDKKTWQTLFAFGELDPQKKPSSQQIMQAAIEKKLENTPPKMDVHPQPEKEDAVLELLSRPEFSEDEAPFTDLEELYTEYKTIAKHYTPEIASNYWLFTRSVHGLLLDQLTKNRSTQNQSLPLFEQIHSLLEARYLQEQPTKPEQHEQVYKTIEELYPVYKQFSTQQGASNDYKTELEWLATLPIHLSPEDKISLSGKTTVRQEDFALANRKTDPDTNSLANHELIGLWKILSRRKYAEANKKTKQQEEQRKIVQTPPRKKEIPPELQQIQAVVETIIKNVLPILEESSKELEEDIQEIAALEFDKLPEEFKSYLQEFVDHGNVTGAQQDTPLEFFTRQLLLKAISEQKKSSPPPKKKSFWKKLFGK